MKDFNEMIDAVYGNWYTENDRAKEKAEKQEETRIEKKGKLS